MGRGPQALRFRGHPLPATPSIPLALIGGCRARSGHVSWGTHRHTRWAGTAKPVWTELLGEGSSLQAHRNQPHHPSPATRGSPHTGELVRSLSSARLPRAGGWEAHSPGLRPGSPRRLSEQLQVRVRGIRCPCSDLSSAAAFLSTL